LVIGALLTLLAGGMIMYLFERKHQPYFDHAPKDAVFPAFWWALNLVVNGGFEERMPQSKPGRAFGVFLVIGSLFFVSIFVAQITAALTVSAIQENIDSLSDLEGHSVGTIQGSTTSAFLIERGILHQSYDGLGVLLAAFEADEIEAVVFDGPILAYYVETQSQGEARLLDRIYRSEKYGMVFEAGSIYREAVDQAFLRLREDGTYDSLTTKWFGTAYGPR
jgi:polar amino acid transport system substrate-binding protein